MKLLDNSSCNQKNRRKNMTEAEIEKYIRETMAYLRKTDKESSEGYFVWAEDYIRKTLYTRKAMDDFNKKKNLFGGKDD